MHFNKSFPALFVFVLLLFSWGSWSQSVSIEFNNVSWSEGLNQLMEETHTKIYYAQEWLPEQTLNKKFENTPFAELLANLLEETPLNFFKRSEQEWVITKNTMIYDLLMWHIKKEAISSKVDIRQLPKTPASIRSLERVAVGKSSNTLNPYARLSGRIVDAVSKKGLSEVSIGVEELDLMTVTDEHGNYQITLPKNLLVISVQSMGYQNTQISVDLFGSWTLNFALEEQVQELDEVVLRATSLNQVNQNQTGQNNIGGETSKTTPLLMGERDVLKIAAALPGISSAGETATGFNVRGGKTDQNLTLLDGATLFNPTHFFGLFQAINSFSVESMNVYKGTVPGEYGGRLSSVFELNTKNPEQKQTRGEVSLGPVTFNAFVTTPIAKEKSGISVGVRGAYADWVFRSIQQPKLKDTKASFYDIHLKHHTKLGKNLDLTSSYYKAHDQFSSTADSLYTYTNEIANLSLRQVKSNGVLFKSQIYLSKYAYSLGFEPEQNALGFRQSSSIQELGLRSVWEINPDRNTSYRWGTTLQLMQLNPGKRTPARALDETKYLELPQEKGAVLNSFFQADWNKERPWAYSALVRPVVYSLIGPTENRNYIPDQPLSIYSLESVKSIGNWGIAKTYPGLEFNMGARLLLGEQQSLKASFNRAYQFIHTLTNNTTSSPLDLWKLSTVQIKPQQSNQWVLGYYKNFDQSISSLTIEGFYKKQKNIIDFKTGADLELNEFVETELVQGIGTAYGVELLIKHDKGNLTGWIGYTYSRSLMKLDSPWDAERVNNGRYFPSNFDKPHELNLVSTLKLTRRLSLSENLIFQTGRPITFPRGKFKFQDIPFVIYSDRNQYRIPDYFRIDASLNLEGSHRKNKLAHSFWNFSVYNILGRNNPNAVYFINQDGVIKAYQNSIFAVAIPSISYTLSF